MSTNAHIDAHDLALFVSEKLDADSSSGIQSHVRVCAACEDRLVAGFVARIAELNHHEEAGNSSHERRDEGRSQSAGHGYIQALYPLSFERLAVQVVDVSKSGFGLLTNSFLATGQIVQICVGTAFTLGEIVSSHATDNNQFRLGIRARSASELKRRLV